MTKPFCKRPLASNRHRFRKELRQWFEREGKVYPWRQTRDPYEILVSEVMLQQTRIATVLEKGYYHRFLDAFPGVAELAEAGDEALLKAWEGLGYYRRSRMLRDLAKTIMERHAGRFPEDLELLLSLPGVGRYTAGALRAFAFEKPAVLVDGNVTRVLARLFDLRVDVHSSRGSAEIWSHAEELADDEDPRRYHSALMELGQTHCRVGTPACETCPVSAYCATREPWLVPNSKVRQPARAVTEHAVWYRDQAGRVLLHRESGSRRTGLWKLPLRGRADLEGLSLLTESRYSITCYRVLLRVWDGGVLRGEEVERDGDQWFEVGELDGLAMAAPFRKVLGKLLQDW